MENNNLYDADSYYIIAGVDTTYSAEDVYANQANEYQLLRSHFLEGLTALLIGILGCIVTLYYLILVSGYKTEERLNPYLHGFDMITTESCIAMTALSTMFALFLGEKIIYRLIHLLVIESEWDYAERIVRALIVYGCCMTGAFSLLRRYKSRQLWENSVVHHVTQNIQTYFTNGTFSKRLACLYGGFISVQVVCLGLIGVCLRFWHYPIAKAGATLLIAGLITVDYLAFHRLYISSTQEDRIADAISMIASGDTGYQMDLDGLSGKELGLGK